MFCTLWTAEKRLIHPPTTYSLLHKHTHTHTYTHTCPDALVEMEKAMKRDKIHVNDRQLACSHISSTEGQNYLKAMAAAANYAWVNRSSMTFLTRQVGGWAWSQGSYSRVKFLILCRLLPRPLIQHPMILTCTSSMTSHITLPK